MKTGAIDSWGLGTLPYAMSVLCLWDGIFYTPRNGMYARISRGLVFLKPLSLSFSVNGELH
jgi:hypothetical protein